MEITEGLGRRADVWVDGHLLTVCDDVSEPDRPCPPGVLDGASFRYVTHEAFTWDQAVAGNRAGRKRLDSDRGWAYTGYGQVRSILPVVIDFGLFEMHDANWTTDESLVGKSVRVTIDRLEVTRAQDPDWPEGMR